MTLTKSATRNGAGTLENIKNTINLTGKILRNGAEEDSHILGVTPGQGTGTGPIFSAISGLQNLFKVNDFGEFKVVCGNSPTENVLFIASGVRFNSMNFEKTPDNWTQTVDYTIDLEFFEPLVTGYPLVQQTSDNWSIEPLEEYSYTSFRYNINQRNESYNPKLQPTAPTINGNNITYVPPENANGPTNDSSYLNVVTIPQFKISRKVSAVGLANPANSGQINGAGNRSYKEAQKWVESRLATAFTATQNNSTPTNSGMPNFSSGAITSFANFSKTFLFNHLRTTNFSVTDGSYEVNESWLAMPTGIMYTEDYNVDTSTDDRFVRTVRVQGSIKGLHMVPLSIMSGSLQPEISGTGFIDLSYVTGLNPIQANQNHGLLDILNPPTASATALTSSFQSINSLTTINSPNKYENANSGWLYDIKPYLYRRACLVVNSLDRDYSADENKRITNRTLPIQSGIGNTPKNPSYVRENLLNIIPVSTTEGHDPRKGTISYTYEFSNKFNAISGVLSENITTNQTNPVDLVAEAFVLGRRLGPVLQNLSARTISKKDVTIEVSVVPPMSIGGLLMTSKECPLYTGGVVYNNISTIIEGLKPYGDRGTMFGNFDTRSNQDGTVYLNNDTETWNPTEGKYIRSASWVFQPCTNSRRTLDN
jgi:hypothetical protein